MESRATMANGGNDDARFQALLDAAEHQRVLQLEDEKTLLVSENHSLMRELDRLRSEQSLPIPSPSVHVHGDLMRFDSLENIYSPSPSPVVNVQPYTSHYTPINVAVKDSHSQTRYRSSPISVVLKDSQSQASPTVSVSEKTPQDLTLATAINMLADVLTKRGEGLPKKEPEVYCGDAFNYPVWANSFKVLVEDRYTSAADRCYYLGKYTGGEAKRSIAGLLALNTMGAYDKAKHILQERYGNKIKLAENFREKIDMWPTVKLNDGKALREFSDFLFQCDTAMSTLGHLRILNDASEHRKILAKLPRAIQVKWVNIVDEWVYGKSRNDSVDSGEPNFDSYPSFARLCQFVGKQARIACNPLFAAPPVVNNMPTPLKPTLPRKPTNTSSFTCNQQSGNEVGNFKGQQNGSTVGYTIKPCIVCREIHYLDKCPVFIGKSLSDRVDCLMKNGLCMGCFRYGHKKRDCKKKRQCSVCKGWHPTLLHDYSFQKTEREVMGQSATAHCIEASATCDCSHSLIVPVFIHHRDRPEDRVVTYALLDDQSDACFVTDTLVDKINASGIPVQLKLSTVLAEGIVACNRYDGLVVRGVKESNELPLPSAYSRKGIPAKTSQIPIPETARRWSHLQDVADQLTPFLKDVEIGLLIGLNCPKAIRPTKIVAGGDSDPYGVNTALGWGIIGVMNTMTTDTARAEHFAFRTDAKEIKPAQVYQMFDLDFSEQSAQNPNETISIDDRRFIDIVQNNIVHREDGHFEIPLPLKDADLKLPDNRSQGIKRLNQIRAKMRKQPTFKKDYIDFMNKLIFNGHAELVPEKDLSRNDGAVWYAPHHGVYHPQKPGKIRVVFDFSAEFQGHVLNRNLLQGPDMTNNLTGVLARFRKEPIAITCDIESMFYQVGVAPEYRDYLRFLWFKDGDLDAQPITYRMTVHPFGAKSSPGCANFALKTTAMKFREEFGTEASDFVKRNFSVDDGLSALKTTTEAIALVHSSKGLCGQGGFNLTKFLSNVKEVVEEIPVSCRAKGIQNINLNCESLPIERALGIAWHVESDIFKFSIQLKDQPLTRRGILSTISSVFDPLGLVSPFILQGKAILQELCRNSADWDDPISEECSSQWAKWRTELITLANLEIPRCYKSKKLGAVKSTELIHFSDASTKGYGQCSYLRLVDENGEVETSLVMAKSRVAPSKTVTIPRLELTAAVVSVRVSNFLNRELDYGQLDNYYYTDSKVVLGYINNESRKFHIFVANRVQQIRDITSPQQWQHVDTLNNPADLASRGTSAKDLMESSLWWKGPELIRAKELSSARDTESHKLKDNDPEVKRTCTVLKVEATRVAHASLLERMDRFSSWFKLKRAIALALRYLRILRDRVHKGKVDEFEEYKNVGVKEMQSAETVIFRLVQGQAYADEITFLKGTNDAEKQNVRASSPLSSLDPFVDENMLLRVGGRIRNAKMSAKVKHPVLIPRRSHVTSLLVEHYHKSEGHGGRGTTLNSTRTAGYWIVGGRSVVTSHIMQCVTCRKLRGKPCGQKMANLPPDRLEPAAPFTYSGVDYFGHFTVKEGRNQLKRWGVLFTCMSSRAIHIETANSLDTDSFLHAYRRFVCRRGPVRVLRSDRGTNFIGGKNELDAALAEMDNGKISRELLKDSCDWITFEPNFPHSSHMGGVWERMIGCARNVLGALLLKHKDQINDEILRTLLAEVEQIVNSRPLTFLDTKSPESLEPLSPNQLLTLKSKVVKPLPGKFVSEDVYCRRRWRRIQYLANQFWVQWRNEFMLTLQQRKKWTKTQRNLKVNDVVIVLDDSLARCDWPMGRVIEALVGKDGLVRKVKLQVGKSVLERPVHKVVLLLTQDDHVMGPANV